MMKIKYLKNIAIIFIVGIIAVCAISCEDDSESPVLSMTAFQTYIDGDGNTKDDVDLTSCGIQGRVYIDGGAAITSRGVCWNKIGNDLPTVDDMKSEADLGSGTGFFEVDVDGLTPDTDYQMRTYAVNADGHVGYGWVLEVSTESDFE